MALLGKFTFCLFFTVLYRTCIALTFIRGCLFIKSRKPVKKRGGGCVLFLHNTHIRLKLSCSVSNCGPHKEKQIRIHQREKGKAIVRFRYIIPLTLPLTERDISDGCLSTLGGYSRQKEEDCHHWPPDFVFLDRVDIHMREYRNSYYIHLDFFDR